MALRAERYIRPHYPGGGGGGEVNGTTTRPEEPYFDLPNWNQAATAIAGEGPDDVASLS